MSTDTKLPDSEASEQHDTDVEVVDYDDLRGDRDEQYNNLVQDSARMVRSGLLGVEDCQPATMVDDGQEPSEQFIQRFQEDVEAELEQLTPSREDRQTQRAETKTTVDATEIDWPRVWTEGNVDANKPQSYTQADLLIDISEQTPITAEGAGDLRKDAIEAGLLEEFDERSQVKPVSQKDV